VLGVLDGGKGEGSTGDVGGAGIRVGDAVGCATMLVAGFAVCGIR
jgi:hypothetical protein